MSFESGNIYENIILRRFLVIYLPNSIDKCHFAPSWSMILLPWAMIRWCQSWTIWSIQILICCHLCNEIFSKYFRFLFFSIIPCQSCINRVSSIIVSLLYNFASNHIYLKNAFIIWNKLSFRLCYENFVLLEYSNLK